MCSIDDCEQTLACPILLFYQNMYYGLIYILTKTLILDIAPVAKELTESKFHDHRMITASFTKFRD